jgi:hypothetical protein
MKNIDIVKSSYLSGFKTLKDNYKEFLVPFMFILALNTMGIVFSDSLFSIFFALSTLFLQYYVLFILARIILKQKIQFNILNVSKFFGSSFVVGSIMLISLLFFVIPYFIVMVLFTFINVYLLIYGFKIKKSIAKSVSLVKRNVKTVLIYHLSLFILNLPMIIGLGIIIYNDIVIRNFDNNILISNLFYTFYGTLLFFVVNAVTFTIHKKLPNR